LLQKKDVNKMKNLTKLACKSACLLLLSIFLFGSCTPQYPGGHLPESVNNPFRVVQIVTDTLFNSQQRISILTLDKGSHRRYRIDFAYQTSELLKTSRIAESMGAVAAINGGFFDMDNGGSVTYFEKNDSIVSRTRSSEFKWAVPDSLVNGAILLNKNHGLEIEAANSEQYYESSNREAFVMISGPLLISDSKSQKLPDMSFTNMRHPRSCVGITKESIIFIVVDGRSEQAAGMSLIELQEYMLELACIDAINLDGGGSSSLWTLDKGLINVPSDKTGERPVANAILIMEE
jgi:exopolysaccharide biosynthesis protein